METNNLFVKDSSHYLDGDLIDILDFRSDDLKIDKKTGKILLFIILTISVAVLRNSIWIIAVNCIYFRRKW